MPAVHRRDRKKAKKAAKKVTFAKLPKAYRPVWFRGSHKKDIDAYFNEIREKVKDDAHDDDDELFIDSLVGEDFTAHLLEGPMPLFMETLADALSAHALTKKKKRQMEVIDKEARKVRDYLCDTFPKYEHEIHDLLIDGLIECGVYAL